MGCQEPWGVNSNTCYVLAGPWLNAPSKILDILNTWTRGQLASTGTNMRVVIASFGGGPRDVTVMMSFGRESRPSGRGVCLIRYGCLEMMRDNMTRN